MLDRLGLELGDDLVGVVPLTADDIAPAVPAAEAPCRASGSPLPPQAATSEVRAGARSDQEEAPGQGMRG